MRNIFSLSLPQLSWSLVLLPPDSLIWSQSIFTSVCSQFKHSFQFVSFAGFLITLEENHDISVSVSQKAARAH